MTWFYEFNGVQKGPVSDVDLDRLIAEGTVLPTTLVWREGLANWTPLAQARALAPMGGFAPAAGTTQCQSCGRFFDQADLVQIAGRNICAACKPAVLQGLQQGTLGAGFGEPARHGPPWEERESVGWMLGAWRTITGVLARPSETFSNMRVDGGIGDPFLYYLLVGGVCGAARVIMEFAIARVFKLPVLPFGRAQEIFAAGAMTIASVVLGIVMGFVAIALCSFIFAGVFHLCLMMFGGARRPFETTYRVICYGAGSVSIMNLIPMIGAFIALPWTLVAWIIGLARAHETDLWRAVMAILLPFALCCLALVSFVMLVVGSLRH